MDRSGTRTVDDYLLSQTAATTLSVLQDVFDNGLTECDTRELMKDFSETSSLSMLPIRRSEVPSKVFDFDFCLDDRDTLKTSKKWSDSYEGFSEIEHFMESDQITESDPETPRSWSNVVATTYPANNQEDIDNYLSRSYLTSAADRLKLSRQIRKPSLQFRPRMTHFVEINPNPDRSLSYDDGQSFAAGKHWCGD